MGRYDVTYAQIINSVNALRSCSDDPIYTTARECLSLTVCGTLAVEVVQVRGAV